MRAWMSIRNILDMAEEELAIRAGLLLTDHNVFDLIEGTELEPWANRLRGDPDEVIGIRPEFFEDITRVLRAGVGNLPDATPPILRSVRLMRELKEADLDPQPVLEAFTLEIRSGAYKVFGKEICDAVREKTAAPKLVVDAVFLMLADQLDRGVSVLFRKQEESIWDGVVPLADLFSTESIPRSDGAYIDQRYIDFLAAQPDKITRMHWRNFERLTAEFFARLDYEVHLGPGTKDGGVDVRIWPKNKTDGPPMILVQCKRHEASNLVAVEFVKALWSDVEFEGATKGLIATTSRVTPEGKRLANARKYRLEFAEAQQVVDWTSSMWRLSWHGKGKTEGLGRYLLPPFYPIRPGDLDFIEKKEL